ncbi:MAG TPA: DUF4340 domain-containing protein [Gammaproteobacteria bacterium]|nr:DUF4340 domain-containing protein [Gammaproteobacteria bacterium]
MKRRWLLNIGLAVLLAALALLAWFQPGAETARPKPTITTLAPDAVTTIRLEQPNQATAVFKRTAEGWEMVQPVSAPANDQVIKNWLASARETSSRAYPAKDLDLAQFGLKPPRLSLTLNNQRLDFGASDPIEHKRYIRRGDTIYLVNDVLFYQLQGDPLSFLSKRLLPRDPKIIGIKLPNVEISQNKSGEWQLTPTRPNISSDQIQSLIESWQHSQAFNVKAAERAPATGKVTIRLAGQQKPITFRILKNDSLLVLARPDLGVEYQLPANRRNDLLKLTAKKQ